MNVDNFAEILPTSSGAPLEQELILPTPQDVEDRVRTVDIRMQATTADVAAAGSKYPAPKVAQWDATMKTWAVFVEGALWGKWERAGYFVTWPLGSLTTRKQIEIADEYEKRAELVRAELQALGANVTTPPGVHPPTLGDKLGALGDRAGAAASGLVETVAKIAAAGLVAWVVIDKLQNGKAKK